MFTSRDAASCISSLTCKAPVQFRVGIVQECTAFVAYKRRRVLFSKASNYLCSKTRLTDEGRNVILASAAGKGSPGTGFSFMLFRICAMTSTTSAIAK